MKLIVVKGEELDHHPDIALKLMKERQSGNMVVLLSEYCRTKTVEKYYRHANMFVVDGGMFAFSGCHTLYHKPLAKEEINMLKACLGDMECAIYEEVENACGGALKLFEIGKWKERPYLLLVKKPSETVCQALLERFDMKAAGEDRFALFPKGITYEVGIAACAKEAGVRKEDIILW